MTEERKFQDIGHCRRCKMQWVVKDGAKGVNTSEKKGQRCPDCKSADVYYEKELNR